MHLLIVGGSGRTGQLIIDKAISRNHQVTALVRRSASLAPRNNLTVVEGTALNVDDIDTAFTANKSSTPTAVVIALNARRTSDSPFAAPAPDSPPRMMADSVANTIGAMKKHGAQKIVVLSAVGVGSSFGSLNFLLRPIFKYSNMRFQLDDHNAVDEETRGAGVDFVLVRPSMLVEGVPAEIKVYPDDGKGSGFMPKITRTSVARFIVTDALESTQYDGRAPVITN